MRIAEQLRPSAHRGTLVALCAVVVCLSHSAWGADKKGETFFREKIEPALKRECYACHSAKSDSLEGNLRLDSPSGIRKGGDSGPAVDLKQPGESLILQALRHEGGLEMPPETEKLDKAIIADFAKWVAMGAPDPRTDTPPLKALEKARKHWAFQPVEKVAPPDVENGDWVINPIDAFVLKKLEERGWTPAPAASRREWIRRVTYDLTGLPPAPAEIDSFLADRSPRAYERVVDRLLANPHYGERWAQHWLDVVRFAETEGYEYDRHLPDAWRYRDYVIDAFNTDKPFDRFVTEQIAGDELAEDNIEYLSAAVLHRLGAVRRNAGNPDIALSRNEVLTERTDIIGTAFLGLTVGCARCHNHKLEPISQRDYYSLQAYLAATREENVLLASAGEKQKWEAATKRIQDQIKTTKKELLQAGPERDKELRAALKRLEGELPDPLPTVPSIRNDLEERTAIHVLRRGVWENKGVAVAPRPLTVLVSESLEPLPADVENPRTRLAKWLTSPENPLTRRVFVNRIWQHHFGTGIVQTPNDFGTHGGRPSHPELLDWLTTQFAQFGGRTKPLHRLVVLSNTYRQSSRASLAEAQRDDPENRLLWHFMRRRLSAEEIRDAMLAVSGRLNKKAGGPSVIVPVDQALVDLLYKPEQWEVSTPASEHDRRSVYLIAKRNLRLPFMEAFDIPTLQRSCPRREASTHSPQALAMLNGSLSNELAMSFAERLKNECGGDDALARRAFRLALGRKPTAKELALSLSFLQDQPLEEFTLAVFNLNGFLYVD